MPYTQTDTSRIILSTRATINAQQKAHNHRMAYITLSLCVLCASALAQFTSCFSLPQQLLLYLFSPFVPNACLFVCLLVSEIVSQNVFSLSLFLPIGFRSTCFASFRFDCLFISAEPSVFQAQPPTPPSAAQEATQSPIESSPFLHSVKRLFLNVNYILLLISYGMNVGVFYAISTLLNRVSMQILDKNLWKQSPFAI